MINFLYEFKNETRTEIKFWEDDHDDGQKYTLYDTDLDGLQELLSLPICSPGFYDNRFCMNQNTSAFLSILHNLEKNKVYFWTIAYTSGYHVEETGYLGIPSFFIVLLDENYKIIDMINYSI